MRATASWLLTGVLILLPLGCGTPEEPPAAPATADPGTMGADEPDSRVVATVGGQAFTMDDLDARAMMLDIRPYQSLYETRRRALQEMLGEQLLDAEAAERGITRDELVNLEINQKLIQPSQEQVRQFYEHNKSKLQGRPFEEVSAQLPNMMNRENRDRLVQELLNSLRVKYAVSFTLEPPRVPVTIAENDPTKGPDGAPVQIVEFSDFQ
jgi:hypothetical protein